MRAGCIPGNALAFLTLYLQLLAMSDLAASCITVAFLVGQAFGACRCSWSTLCKRPSTLKFLTTW